MRLFVAIELSAEILRTLVRLQRSLTPFDRMVRWVGAEQMHLTLKFLGDVPDGRISDVTAALALAADASRPFTLATAGAGCFPPTGKVRVVWVGLGADGTLLDCQAHVESALADVGFPKEARAFSPHLTLGRVKDDHRGGELRAAAEQLSVPQVAQEVASIVLMQSELRPEGARHMVLGTWPLMGEV